MEEPSPKRRKTSPIASSTTGYKMKQRNAKPPPEEPSCRSPTKASLARSYPHRVAPKSNVSKIRSPLRQASSKPAVRKLFNRHGGRGVSHSETATKQKDDDWSSANPTSKSTTGGTLLRSTDENALSATRSASRLTRQSDDLPRGPRASPPEPTRAASQTTSAEHLNSEAQDEDHAAPRRGLHDSDVHKTPSKPSSSSYDEPEFTEDGEPRLPSTPTQLGLEPPPKPPSGLFSSGSPRKRRGRLTSVPTSSPLKRQKAIAARLQYESLLE
ncbi:MAG: hypothetical protein LQ338_005318 [Usnochroma carphineum]|nr:MAG: hypothetical protein LQ338_005318 [Usnochroma carphineum]